MAKKLIIKSSGKPAVKAVGPGKPPEHSRFKPGQSGNPAGRPKGAKNLTTVLVQELRRKVTMTVDGKEKRMAVQDLIARRLANDSVKGVIKATELLIRMTSGIRGEDDPADGASAEAMPDKEALRRIRARIDKLVDEEDQ